MKKIIRLIRDFYESQRQSGTTSLLKSIEANNDIYILVPNEQSKEQFKWAKNCISFADLENIRHGKAKKPILIDNYTMLELCEKTNQNFLEYEKSIEDRDLLINSIEHLVKKFKEGNAELYVPANDNVNHRRTRTPNTYFK